MWDAKQGAEICKEPWDGAHAVMHRLYGFARKGLVHRADDSDKDGLHIRFAARDLAVFRILEAARADRADAEVLKALAYACYYRPAPDRTAGFAAPIYWAARCLLGLSSGDPVISAYRIAPISGDSASSWVGTLVDAKSPVGFGSDTELVAQLVVPLGRALLPVLPLFKFREIEKAKRGMN